MKNEEGQNSSDSSLGTFMDALVKEFGPDFRWELAFAEFTDDMVKTLRAYGGIESLPADVVLYTHGDRTIDMFVVLDGEVDILLPSHLPQWPLCIPKVQRSFACRLLMEDTDTVANRSRLQRMKNRHIWQNASLRRSLAA